MSRVKNPFANMSLLDSTNAKKTIQEFLDDYTKDILNEYIANALKIWEIEDCQLSCKNIRKNEKEKRFYFDIHVFYNISQGCGCADIEISKYPTMGIVIDFFIDYENFEFGNSASSIKITFK